MGHYRELVLNCEFNKEIPSDVIGNLRYLLGETGFADKVGPDEAHLPFGLLQDNVYGSANGDSILKFDDVTEMYYLLVHTNTKDAIQPFLAWIAPYSDRQGFVGYVYGSTFSDQPDLIFFENGQAYFVEVTLARRIEIR